MKVNAQLIEAWSQLAMEPSKQLSRSVGGIGPDSAEKSAMGTGFAAVHAAVSGDLLPATAPSDQIVGADAGVQHYLTGVATGIEATGADQEAISLVTGLIAGAARLQYYRVGTNSEGVSAAEFAARAGVAAADAAGEGADLAGVAAAAAGAAFLIDGPSATAQTDDARLHGLIALVLAALKEVVVPEQRQVHVAGCGAGPGESGGRRFLAEVTFGFAGSEQAADALAATLDKMATDLKVWGDEQDLQFHLHTVEPGAAVAEAFALGTVFNLRVGTLEPPPQLQREPFEVDF